MKTLKRGIRWWLHKFVPKVFNLIVIFGLVLQPVGPAGVYSLVLAQSDEPVAPAVEEPAPTPDPVEEEAAPVEEPAEEPAPVTEPVAEETPAVTPLEVENPELVEGNEPVVVPPAEEPAETPTEPAEETPETSPETPADTASETPLADEAVIPVDMTVTPTDTATLPVADTLTPSSEAVVPEVVTPEVLAPVVETWGAAVGNKATTNGPVVVGTTYVAPQNDNVTVTFTKLPDTPGKLSIEEITLTDKQVTALGALSNKAYDITSDMADGTFEYALTLPKPADQENVQIKFAEDVAGLKNADTIPSSDVKTENDSVSATLDHFTIFIITDDSATYSGTWIDYATQGYYEDGVHYPVTVPASQTATWTFSSLAPAGSYNVYVSWSTHSNRTQAAPYILNYNGGSTTPFVVNQEKLADQTTVGTNGQWSGWYLLGSYSLNTASNLVLSSVDNSSGTDYVIADEILLAPNTAPTTVWVDDNYTINSKNDGHVWGYDAFATVQAGINAVDAGGTVNVAEGTYIEIGQVVINKNLSIVGENKTTTVVKPAQDTVGNNVDTAAWFLVQSGRDFNLSNVTLDGDSLIRNTNWAIASYGTGIINNNIIKNVKESTYLGRGIVVFGDMTVSNNTFQNIERIGVHVRGAYSGSAVGNATVTGNTYIGKGSGNFLDYGVEVGAGADAVITGNTITACNGVASSDGSTSAGVLVTDYFGTGTTATVNNNDIFACSAALAVGFNATDDSLVTASGNSFTDNEYGISLVGSSGSPLTLSNNTFSGNTWDIHNEDADTVNAINTTSWSVADQSNLNQIEAVVDQDCVNSPYVHGSCNAEDNVAYGFVKYAEITTPTNEGWNLASQSATPNEQPLDLVCTPGGVYVNENSVAQNWSSVAGSNIKYQREVTFPNSSVAFFNTTNSNNFTPFSSFGAGDEGQWGTRVLAYVDADGDNVIDAGEETSAFSNLCNITYDVTAPTVTQVTPVPTPTTDNTPSYTFNSSETGAITYGGDCSSATTAASAGNNTIIFNALADGVRSNCTVTVTDPAGNASNVLSVSSFTVDATPPNAPTPTSPADGAAIKPVAFSQTWTAEVDAVQYRYQSCNVDPGDVGAVCSNVKFEQLLAGTVKNVGAGQPNSHFWWRVQARDTIGNWSLYGEAFELFIDGTDPIDPTPLSTSHNLSDWDNDRTVAVSWSGASDALSGVDGFYTEWNTDATTMFGTVVKEHEETVTSETSPQLATGQNHYFHIATVDNAGNWTSTEHLGPFWIDASNPVASWTTPTNGALLSGTENLEVSANDPDSGMQDVRFRYRLVGSTGAFTQISADASDPFQATWDTTSVADGDYTLRALARNNAGGTRTINITVTVDNTAPTVTAVDSDGQTYSTATVSPHTIKVTFSEDIAIVPDISVSGGAQVVNNCGDVDVKTFCFAYAIPPTQDTEKEVQVLNARDIAGNTMVNDFSHTFAVDTIVPTVDLVFPGTGPAVTSFDAVFNEDVNEAEAENAANYFLNNWPGAGGTGDLFGDATVVYDALTFTATVTFTNLGWYVSPEQEWGVEDIHDLAGNLQATNPYSETSTPMVAPVVDTGSAQEVNALVSQNATATDPAPSSGILSYLWTNQTPLVGTITFGSPSSEDTTISASADGQYFLRLTVTDNAGNVGSGEMSFVWDTTKPASVITTFGLADGESVTTPTWDGFVEGTASDDRSGVNHVNLVIKRNLFPIPSVDEYWNGTDWQATTVKVVATGTDNWFYSLPTPEEGVYNITSHAVDNASNEETTYSITIIYDKTIPEVTLAINPVNPEGDNNWYLTNSTVTLTANDNYNVDHIEYQLNGTGGAWITYVSPVTLDDGVWQFYYRSIDTASNVSGIGVKNVKVDTTDPDNVKSLEAEYRPDTDDVKLTWNVDDDDTKKVYIYRGGSKNFTVNSASRIAIQDDNDEEYTDDNITPGETYFYKLVARDDAGNNSDARVVKIIIPVTEVPAFGTDEGTEVVPEGTVLGAEIGEGQVQGAETTGEDVTAPGAGTEGAVLGAASEGGTPGGFWNWIENHPWWTALIALIALLLGYYGYGVYQRRNEPLQ